MQNVSVVSGLLLTKLVEHAVRGTAKSFRAVR